MGFTVTEIQPTPNPNASKFMLDRPVSDQPVSFLRPADGASHPLAQRLFAVDGVVSILLLGNFITVNKSADARWSDVSRKVKRALAAFDPPSE